MIFNTIFNKDELAEIKDWSNLLAKLSENPQIEISLAEEMWDWIKEADFSQLKTAYVSFLFSHLSGYIEEYCVKTGLKIDTDVTVNYECSFNYRFKIFITDLNTEMIWWIYDFKDLRDAISSIKNQKTIKVA